MKNGALIVRRDDAVGVILVRDSGLFEKYAFTDGNKLLGDIALNTVKSWRDGTVSAYQFEAEIVEVLPSLLRGDPCYQDLRLDWADWNGLLADLCRREEAFVVELDTPRGRGVTCISGGRQIATFTADHPELGDASLLDALAGTRKGTVWVWKEPAAVELATPQPAAAAAPAPAPIVETVPEPEPSPATAFEPLPEPAPDIAPAAAAPAPAPAATEETAAWPAPAAGEWPGGPAPSPFGGSPFGDQGGEQAPMQPLMNPFASDAGTVAPFDPFGQPEPQSPFGQPEPQSPFAAQPQPQFEPFTPPTAANGAGVGGGPVSPETVAALKLIARQRLQRSAARVEAMLDEVTTQGRSLDGVLVEIRGLVIRGVMQSTLDEVVDEMTARVRQG